jgi:hypothetical protein
MTAIAKSSSTAMAPSHTVSSAHQDSYTRHLRVMSRFYRVFNSDMPIKDIEGLCWATWSGCHCDPQAAIWLSIIQANERCFKPETNIGQKVQGYSGQYWYTLITAAKAHGMKRPRIGWRPYFLKHPYLAEYHIARWFKEEFYDRHGPWETIAIWHRGRDWKESRADIRDVNIYRSNFLTTYNKYYVPVAMKTSNPYVLTFAGEPMKKRLDLLYVVLNMVDKSTQKN